MAEGGAEFDPEERNWDLPRDGDDDDDDADEKTSFIPKSPTSKGETIEMKTFTPEKGRHPEKSYVETDFGGARP